MTATIRLTLACGLLIALGLCSCGDSQESAAPHNRALGDTKEGAPLVTGETDAGILEDPANYTPTQVEGALDPSGSAEERGGAGGGDADDQVRATVQTLVTAMNTGDAAAVLELFNAEQVALLAENPDVVLSTFEKVSLLKRILSDKLGELTAEQLAQALGGSSGVEPTWDLLDAEHASVRPNVTAMLLGPVRPSEALALAREADGWRIQLESPLTAEDVDAVVAYHTALQAALDGIINWADEAEQLDEAQLQALLLQALQGQPPALGDEDAPGVPETQPDEEAEPKPEGEDEQGNDEGDEPDEPGENP